MYTLGQRLWEAPHWVTKFVHNGVRAIAQQKVCIRPREQWVVDLAQANLNVVGRGSDDVQILRQVEQLWRDVALQERR